MPHSQVCEVEEGVCYNYNRNYELTQLKLQVDEWVLKYDKWISSKAHEAQRKYRLYNCADDLKSELVLEAYNCIHRFDATRGTPFNTFLLSTLWKFATRSDIIDKVQPRISLQVDIQAREQENYSIEVTTPVSWCVAKLSPEERMLVHLHYESGFQLKQLDEMMGVSQSTTWHRLQRILDKLRTVCRAEG